MSLATEFAEFVHFAASRGLFADVPDSEIMQAFAAAEAAAAGTPVMAPTGTASEIEQRLDDQIADDGDVALAGRDGIAAEKLLDNSRRQGAAALADVARRAIKRLLAGGAKAVLSAKSLFSPDEARDVEDALAATVGTAHLLGRSRIHAYRQRVSKHAENHFEVFRDEPVKPLAPESAVEAFQRLIPTLGIDPQRFGIDMRRHAFTLAATTDQVVLDKVKQVITDRLATGVGVSTAPADISDILERAGVSPRNPQYAEMTFRTNMMDAYNQGAQEELAASADYFPVWKYASIADERSRPTHAAKNGLYYPTSVPFVEVRGKDISDSANCRCTFIPVLAADWKELQKAGARLAPGYSLPATVRRGG